MSQGPLLVPHAGLLSGRSFCAVLYSPTGVGFGLLRWSLAGYNATVVQLSRLSQLNAMGANFLLPYLSRVGLLDFSFPFLS